MSTQVAPVAAVDEVTVAPDRPVHVVCCDPNEALCGTDVSALNVAPDEDEVTCPLCAIAYEEDLPCANPRCPD